MKKCVFVLLVFAMIISLSGCFFQLFQTEMPYAFRQSADQITAIEIIRKQYDSISAETPMYVLKTFEENEYQTVLDGINSVPGGRNGLEPGRGIGLYIIRITYADGEIELLGDYNNGYISTDGKIHQDCYAFYTEEYYDLISSLLGEEITDYTYG